MDLETKNTNYALHVKYVENENKGNLPKILENEESGRYSFLISTKEEPDWNFEVLDHPYAMTIEVNPRKQEKFSDS